ncbi:hypothetical protein [Cecembia lonarensis]|uniref:Uncharacterized protein n=1 Tax=Cecembia lonarensis (strain CCUG 58316 / KCTC 22772 / LW9) TaxID=1225176 RepID=K1LWW8_CECL9|nr:hypothetical protein [Cecembia lonarensis]EKB48664.1 hypothetical protein B879_02691 [Cecembia lonarensis LW9]
MKKLGIILLSIIFLASCAKEKSVEERYVYEIDKVVDIETGDEYFMEEDDEITVIHSDGTKEVISFEEAPFYESALSEDFLRSMEERLQERKLKLLEEKREKIREVRRSRYANISDDELLSQFKQAHKDQLNLSRQIDMIAELIDRGVIAEDEAPIMLEISPELIDFDVELEEPIEN